MEEKQKQRIIRHYDVNALRKNIWKLRLDNEKFSELLGNAERIRDKDNIEVFSKAIRDNEKTIVELEGYIKLVEENRNGNSV